MKSSLSDAMLDDVSRCIAERMGLYFPRSKWRSLEQALGTAAVELGLKNAQECAEWFMSSPLSREHVETLAGYLTIGETYFLRENRCFEILEHEVIPDMLRAKKGHEQRLRIWSAGCATGEEPYSIAIMLHRMGDLLPGYDLSILATDINPHALRKARAGVYSEWAFRTAPPWFKENFFRQAGDKQYELLPHIKNMVTFSFLNLVEDSYPSLTTGSNALDMIFCRNVLMYFTPELAKKVVARFKLCLLEGGWLFVSPCEVSNTFLSGFKPVAFPDATLYRKQGIGEKAESEKGRNGETELVMNLSPIHRFPASPVQESSPVQEEVSHYQQALALYERGAYSEAAAMAASHLSRESNDTQALALLCRIYANEGKLDDALRASDQALAADKLSAGLHYLRAVILQEQGMNDEAAASLKKALYLDQDLVLAHFTLATLEQRKGKVKESQRHFNNALSLLDRYRPDEIIPESDGMFAGRLKEIIRTTSARM